MTAEQRFEAQSYDASIALDFWDGRVSREAHFIQLLRTRFPRAQLRHQPPQPKQARTSCNW